MCKIKIQVNCPHCQSAKVVKNGKKANGTQNYKCKVCGKQFQSEYQYRGCDTKVKRLIIRMLLRNSGIRDICIVLQVSDYLVSKCLLEAAAKCTRNPQKSEYKSVQIDEFWSYVGKKKKGKRWIIYAYCPETKEILGYVIGKRDIKTVKKLYKKIKKLKIAAYYTDNWKAFATVLKKENHIIGKQGTKHIEGVNN